MGDECASTQWPILGVSACRDAVSRGATDRKSGASCVEASAGAWKQAEGRGSKRRGVEASGGAENPRIGNPRLRSAHCPGDRRCNFAVFLFLSSRRFDGGLFPASDFQSVDSSGCFVECFAERSAKCFTESQLFSPSQAAVRDALPKRRPERGQRRQACR